jgi:hypothetical protein
MSAASLGAIESLEDRMLSCRCCSCTCCFCFEYLLFAPVSYLRLVVKHTHCAHAHTYTRLLPHASLPACHGAVRSPHNIRIMHTNHSSGTPPQILSLSFKLFFFFVWDQDHALACVRCVRVQLILRPSGRMVETTDIRIRAAFNTSVLSVLT